MLYVKGNYKKRKKLHKGLTKQTFGVILIKQHLRVT